MQEPDDRMWRALLDFRARHGRRWKDALTRKWMNGDDEREPNSASLRMIRNQFGPSWLSDLPRLRLDNAARRLANLEKLPDMCACPHPETGETIIIKRGEAGYWPMPSLIAVDAFNARPAAIAAMQAGAMFGWHVPAADPDRYDAVGSPLTDRGNAAG
ncbi:hypothetical protein [Sphingomonas sp. IW22]|jgi:hypothetical protein|uniref:hypothetical protein n=1 Tax=Sphingomonas sp. IW22 TaxID=3242489 RepID=UPI00352061F0